MRYLRYAALLVLLASPAASQQLMLDNVGNYSAAGGLTPCGNISTDFSVATGCNIPVMMNLLN
jgi:hypothetical protein